jgi:hypothetical protein
MIQKLSKTSSLPLLQKPPIKISSTSPKKQVQPLTHRLKDYIQKSTSKRLGKEKRMKPLGIQELPEERRVVYMHLHRIGKKEFVVGN